MTEMISEIKKTMLDWYLFDLTDEQIIEYLDKHQLESFDTLEREDYVDYLAKRITGLRYPINMDSNEYINNFYKQLASKANDCGYIWNKQI